MKKATIEKKVGQFTYSFSVVEEGGKFLWTNDNEKDLLGRLLKEGENLKIQKIAFPKGVWEVMEQFLKGYPGVKWSDLARKCVAVYFQKVVTDDRTSQILEDVYQSKRFSKIVATEKRNNVSLKCKPRFFMDIQGWAALEGMSAAEVVVEATSRMMAAVDYCNERDRERLEELRRLERELEQRMAA